MGVENRFSCEVYLLVSGLLGCLLGGLLIRAKALCFHRWRRKGILHSGVFHGNHRQASLHGLASYHKDCLFYLILLSMAPIPSPYKMVIRTLADFLLAIYDFL